MYYKRDGAATLERKSNELTHEQVDLAGRGIRAVLLRRGFRAAFVEENAEEFLGFAQLEYVRALTRGLVINDAVSFLIHCAWQRAQMRIRATDRAPDRVSADALGELADDEAMTPAETVEVVDRAERIRIAIESLDTEERAVVFFHYFEKLSIRETGRQLGMTSGTAQRRFEAALSHLREFFGDIDSSDDLQIAAGLGAWLHFAQSQSIHVLPAGIEAAVDKAGHVASGFWARTENFLRSLATGGGSDASGNFFAAGGGRIAGACATTAVAGCLAIVGTGAVGPGISGIAHDLGGGKDASSLSRRTSERPSPAPSTEAALGPGAFDTSVRPEAKSQTTAVKSSQHVEEAATASASPPNAQTRRHRREEAVVEEQTDPVGLEPIEPEAEEGEEATTSPGEESASPGGVSGPSAKQASQQFGAFH
jgi:RNA polymerase sigma factor (sigma-70 family)